jgi:hypothetical protein
MRHEEYHDPATARGFDERTEIGQQIDLLGDRLDAWPELAAIAQEIVVWIHQQKRSPGRDIIVQRQIYPPRISVLLKPAPALFGA